MLPRYVTLVLALLLAGCASAPTRTDADAFKSLQSGRIPPSSVPAFTDCVMDGFSSAHYAITNVSARQQRRTDGYRVEATTNGILLVSADILESGRVELLESSAAALINTNGERQAFSKCLDRFGARS
jgi:hypothetical protein